MGRGKKMENNDILLAGHRPDGGADGIKIRLMQHGIIKISFLNPNGQEVHGFELAGIADLVELNHVIRRSVVRHRELFPENRNGYLETVRKILSPQTENHETALLGAK